MTNFVSITTFALCIPIFELIIYPLFRNYVPKMTVRIGLGMLLMMIGHLSLFAVDYIGHDQASARYNGTCFFLKGSRDLEFNPYYLVPIIAGMSIGELLIFVSALEFICAQSPYSMRGLIIGIFYFILGLFSLFVALVILLFALPFKYISSTNLVLSCGNSYSLGVLVIGAFGLVLYVFITKWYKNRQRGGQYNINPQAVLEDYFERGLGSSVQMYLNQDEKYQRSQRSYHT